MFRVVGIQIEACRIYQGGGMVSFYLITNTILEVPHYAYSFIRYLNGCLVILCRVLFSFVRGGIEPPRYVLFLAPQNP